MRSQQKLERFLTALAKQNVSASNNIKLLSAIIFFYAELLAEAMSVSGPLDAS